MGRTMRGLSLFSGCGAFDLAAEMAGIEIVGQCEIAKECIRVLEYRWPGVERWKDVHNVTRESVRQRCGHIDLVFGGFPCQPHSLAGSRMGSCDERNLWPELHRVLREVAPRWFVGENVPGMLSTENGRFFGAVLRDLASLGYSVAWGVWGACDVGAPHKRERVFIVAYNHSFGRESWRPEQPREQRQRETANGDTGELADTLRCKSIHREHEIEPTEAGEHAQCDTSGCGAAVAYTESTVCESSMHARRGRCRPTDGSAVEDSGSGGRRQARGVCDIRSLQSEDRAGRSNQSGTSGEVPGVVADAEHDGLPACADGGDDGEDVRQRPEGQERPVEPTGADAPGVLPGELGHADGTGREERDPAAVPSNEGFPAGERARGNVGDARSVGRQGHERRENGAEPADGHASGRHGAQPGVGGAAHGAARRLDFPGWPAGRGAYQHPWEPPRTVPPGAYPAKERNERIRMLGNAVVPQQAYPLFAAIAEIEEEIETWT